MTKFFAAAIGLSLALAPAAFADAFKVSVDQTVAVKIGAPANSVIIGNATVADVTVHDANTILITGKAFGTTNVVVLDRAGKEIWANTLNVGGEPDTGLTIVRKGAVNSYSCVDKCRATPMVGDQPEYFQQVMQTVTGKADTAKGN